jgi:hypothetical protein
MSTEARQQRTKVSQALERLNTPESFGVSVLQAVLNAEQQGKPLPGFITTENSDSVSIYLETPNGRISLVLDLEPMPNQQQQTTAQMR